MIAKTHCGWDQVEFGSLVDSSAFGPRFSGEKYAVNGNIAMLRTTDMAEDGRISYETMPLAQLDESRFSKHFLEPGDLVISRSGRIGTTGIFEDFELPVIPDAFLIRFRLKKQINPYFFRYFFNSPTGKHLISSVARGAAQQNITSTNVLKLRIQLPPVENQNFIADVLSTYDDLIENNRRRIQLLEESARLLYKEWFVHLRFPGHEHVVIADGIPEGWSYTELGNLVSDIIDYRGKTPKKLGGSWSDSGIPALSALNIKNNQLVSLQKCKFVDENLYEKWMKSELQKGDILLTSEAPLGQVCYLTSSEKFCLSQRLYAIRANPEVIKPSVLGYAMLSSDMQGEIFARQTGTTVFGIRQTALRQVPVLVPPLSLQEVVSPMLNTLLEQKEVLFQQIDKLIQARDLLLPRLMNGEIAV